MMECGHSQSFRDIVISRVVAKYLDSLARHMSGERPLYRSREEREESVASSGGKSNKSDWFRKSGAVTVLTVASILGGRLASKVREALKAAPDPTGCSTLVREQPGPSIRQSLVRNDPEPRSSCGRSLCPYKPTGELCKMRCYREGVCYVGRCRRCYLHQVEVDGKEEHEVVQEVYLGESSRSVVSRAREHYSGYKLAMRKTARSTASSSTTPAAREEGREDDDEEGSSWMADHAKSHHGGVISPDPTEDYDFFVIGSWQKPLYRQLEEGVRIRKAKTSGILSLGRGQKGKTMLVNKSILNRKLENFSPFFLTMGGGED